MGENCNQPFASISDFPLFYLKSFVVFPRIDNMFFSGISLTSGGECNLAEVICLLNFWKLGSAFLDLLHYISKIYFFC